MNRSDMLRPALVLGFAGLLAACGSSAKTTAATTAPTVAAAATAAPTAAAAATTAAPAAATTAAAGTAAIGTAASGTAAAADGTPVAVTETEFKIDGISATMKAGTYTFDVSNAGKAKHNLIVDGGDLSDVSSDTFTAGQSGKLTVTLKPGTYEFYCGIPTHKGKGMDMTVTVS